MSEPWDNQSWELLARLLPLCGRNWQRCCFSPPLWHMPRLHVDSILLMAILQILGVWHDQDGSHHPWLYQWLLSLHAGELIFSWDNTVPVSCVFQNLSSVSLPRIRIFARGPYLGSEGDILFHLSSRVHQLHLWVDEWSHDWVKIHNTGDLGVYDSHWTWCWWWVLASKVCWWCWMSWLLVQSGGACWLHSLLWKLTLLLC